MAKAEEYRICCALLKAYIVKVSKRNPNTMTDDRREITMGEILTLINFVLRKWVFEHKPSKGFSFENGNGRKIEVHYLDEE